MTLPHHQSTCNYKVTVRTGEDANAGAEGAQLFVSLVGSDGMDSGEVPLALSLASGHDDSVVPLAKDSVSSATFSALEFGKLTAIKLRLVSVPLPRLHYKSDS